MLNQAIIFTQDNAQHIADQLKYYTAQELLDDYGYMFENNMTIVLVREFLDGMPLLSHVVTESMFLANADTLNVLTDHTFTKVVQR